MIPAGTTEFPNNVIALLNARIPGYVDPSSTVEDRVQVFNRPLRQTDPQQCVGIFPAIKRPDLTSVEMRAPVGTVYQREPTLKRYSIIMQSMVKDTDEIAAISVSSILSNRLWRMFYRDQPLDTGLTALAVQVDNTIERLQRRGIEFQRYLDNEVQGTFVRTTWLECWVETETVET